MRNDEQAPGTEHPDGAGVIEVLMVDDHPIVTQAVAKLLSRDPDFRVRTASSGDQALALCNVAAPDVALVDLNLDAKLSGLELIAKMAVVAPQTRVVVFSTSTDTENVSAALDAGAIGYIAKSADPMELPTMIKAAYAGEPVYDAATKRTVLDLFRNRHKVAPAETTLTLRELEVLTCLCHEGGTSKEIADQLFLSTSTVNTHLRSIFGKLKVSNRSKAITEAYRQKLVDPPGA